MVECRFCLCCHGSPSAQPAAPVRRSALLSGARGPARRPFWPTAAAGRSDSSRTFLAVRASSASSHEATQSGGGGNGSEGHEAVGWLVARVSSSPPSQPSDGQWSCRGIAIAAPAARSLQRSSAARSCLRSWSRWMCWATGGRGGLRRAANGPVADGAAE